MILNVYCYRNKAVNAYAIPFFDSKEPKDMGETIKRMTIMYPEKSLDLKVCDLMFLGSFDDISGKFDFVEPEYILSCGDYLKEAKKDE